jgi:hypothetical protein
MLSSPRREALFVVPRRSEAMLHEKRNMKKVRFRPQLDAEIKDCIDKNGPMTGYRICKMIAAPTQTVVYHLRKMLEKGELDAKQGPRTTKTYSLPNEPSERRAERKMEGR